MTGTGNRKKTTNASRLWSQVFYFFPFQLLILHLKRNHLLLLAWLLLSAYITGDLAAKYGVRFLFLFPEYLGRVDFWSHLIVGFALGGFIMAFHIYSYVIHAFRFPFLATLARPFYKFCINNLIIPSLFILLYLYQAVRFQLDIELLDQASVILNMAGFCAGIIIFLVLSLAYFRGTNKDIFRFIKPKDRRKGRFMGVYEQLMQERVASRARRSSIRSWRVDTYLKNPWSIKLARGSDHYDANTLQRVFQQNHLNASLFELLMVISFILIMNFGDKSILEIPGGASVILVFTLAFMLLSIFRSWFRGWTTTAIVLLILIANTGSGYLGIFDKSNALYGLDYAASPAEYPESALSVDAVRWQKEQEDMEDLLGHWKRNQYALNKSEQKPKLLVVLSSGGGLRSALWNTTMLSHLDSLCNGSLMDRCAMMTGASGGILATHYLRELDRQDDGKSISGHGNRPEQAIGQDLLNPVLVSIASTDIFFSLHSFEYKGHRYPVDRASRFEHQFLENTGLENNPSLGDYRKLERRADTPLMLFGPTITNDGRRLLVSSQDASFLRWDRLSEEDQLDHQGEFVDFRRLMAEHDADSTSLLSLVRANATFPYIFPQAELPTEPLIKVMDAGIRDNFGWDITSLFLLTMNDWIAENTSGVILLQVRDKRKDINEKPSPISLVSRLVSPLGNVYGNFTKTQDFHHDAKLLYLQEKMTVPVDLVRFQMQQPGTKNVSMSWHLTALEKQIIQQSVNNTENQGSAQKLLELLDIPR